MITFGRQLRIVAMCPDCEKPMQIQRQSVHSSLNAGVESDFGCVICTTDGCISKGFPTTIEKKTGMVLYTDAMYVYDHKEEKWKPTYKRYGGE